MHIRYGPRIVGSTGEPRTSLDAEIFSTARSTAWIYLDDTFPLITRESAAIVSEEDVLIYPELMTRLFAESVDVCIEDVCIDADVIKAFGIYRLVSVDPVNVPVISRLFTSISVTEKVDARITPP